MKKSQLLLSLAAAAMLCLPALPAAAQQTVDDDATTSYFFVGAQGGAQATFTNDQLSKLVMPFGGVYIGGYASPVVGGRLHLMGFRSKGRIYQYDESYYYDFYTADLDMLLNLSNLFWKNNKHAVNLVLVSGVGLNYAWHNGEVNNILAEHAWLNFAAPLAWKHSLLSHNLRVGLQLDFNVSKHLGLNLEVDANHIGDRFNSKTNSHDDWMATAAVGLSYKFGYKKPKKYIPAAVIQPAAPAPKPAPAPAPKVVETPKPAPAPAPVVKTLKEEIFYNIRSSQVPASEWAKVERIANFLKENPDATAEIVGYADAKTGTPAVNMKYSQMRANDLKEALSKKYGIDGSRISARAKGDTVQPYAENAKNRLTIITGTTKK